MRITMDVFSGRPNPSWRLTPKESQELAARIAGEAVNPDVWRPPTLGFRSLVVEADIDDPVRPVGLPYRFTVGESATTTATPPVVGSYSSLFERQTEKNPATDADNARWLLETAQGKVSDDILSVVQATLEAPQRPTPSMAKPQAEGEAVLERATAPPLDSAYCQPFLTPLRLDFWNSQTVRPYNNCYNYAANFVSNTLAQPGRRSGQVYVSFDCEAVVAAAVADGCMPACEGTHRVLALAIWPGFDFHWWRMHPDDIWAQKLGWWMATNRDNQGRVIGGGLTPEGCDRSPYTTFCGYFYAPLGMQVI